MYTTPLYILVPLSILSIAIVVSNVAVCFLVCLNKNLRTFTNGFIVSLAISDILVGGILFPCYLTNPVGTADFIGYLVSIILLAGVANLCTVTYDRYLALNQPLEYSFKISKIFLKVVAASWIIPVAYSLLPLIWNTDRREKIHKIYLTGLQLIGVVIPYIFIIIAYCTIFRRVRRSLKLRKQFSLNSAKRSKQERRRVTSEAKVAKVFLIVAASFILCWLPVIFITTAGEIFDRIDVIPEALEIISFFTIAFSSLVNPLVYCFMKPDFNKAILKALNRHLKRGGNYTTNDQTIALTPMSVTDAHTVE